MDASYRKSLLFIKCRSLNYASIGTISNTIGATGESVEQIKMTSFLERQNTFLRLLRISRKGRILQKKALFIKCRLLNYASINSISNTIGATGESVVQFEVTSFLERQNTFLCFFRISHKGRILQKMSPLYQMFVIKLRVEW